MGSEVTYYVSIVVAGIAIWTVISFIVTRIHRLKDSRTPFTDADREWQSVTTGPSRKTPSKDIETPDVAISFGYKTAWFAVKTIDTDAVISALQLADTIKVSWDTGLNSMPLSDNLVPVFVTPPVAGWTLAKHDLSLALDSPENARVLFDFLEHLSEKFEEAQHFGNYRVVGYSSWSMARNGRIDRAFSFAGGADGYMWNEGPTTAEEIKIGLSDVTDISIRDLNSLDPSSASGGITRWPDEEDPLKLAELWSVNPTKLGTLLPKKSTGYLGFITINR